MLIDFTRVHNEQLPEVPVCSKTEVLVRDGRTFADFAFYLVKEQESRCCPEIKNSGGSVDNCLELLRQLLR